MKSVYFAFLISIFCTQLFADDLIISSEDSGSEGSPTVYDGGKYDHLYINGASYITVRNASFLRENTNQQWATAVVDIVNSNNILIENSTVDGRDTGTIDYAACTGIDINNSDYVTILNSNISQVADDPIAIGGRCNNVTLRGNIVFDAYSCGTDGDCGPCYNGHSDGIEIWDTTNLTVEDNFVYMYNDTSCFITGGTNTNIIMRNNVFYAPGSGFVAYVYNTIYGAKIYNNTFWGGQYGGIALGGESVSDIFIYNNILHNIHYNHFGVSQQPDHYINNNQLGNTGYGYTPNTNDFVNDDPKFTVAPALFGNRLSNPKKEDFKLTMTSPAINRGTTALNELPVVDISGTLRDNSPDLGAWELQTVGSIARPLNISAISDSSNDGNIPENTIDDNFGTRWSAEGDKEWIEFDLGAVYLITEVYIAFYNGDQRITSFEIQASINKNYWSTIYSGTSSGITNQPEIFYVQPPTGSRYVKIVGHGNSINAWNSITEVDLLGAELNGEQLSPPKEFRILDQ